ncbi:MAG: corrinoid protein [Actinobacteria bacterium]|nr:corrinoid protein [Actinomycetota bacterium]MBU1943198.1 corrinoid protein [Actinomycetota bacterium]MBU2687876.1 corrinoid protein [Actinomycetota bacterium]
MEDLRELVRNGDDEGTDTRVRLLLSEGVSPEAIMKEALIPAMDDVGDLFQKGEFYLPEMLIAARAVKGGLAVLRPMLADAGAEPLGKVVVGSVRGDMHDIGKNLLSMSLEGAGFEVIDLGVDVAPGRFVEAIEEVGPVAIGMSALLTSTMVSMIDTLAAVEASGRRDSVKVMIGGAPVTQAFCDEIGADFYGGDCTAGRDYARSVAR